MNSASEKAYSIMADFVVTVNEAYKLRTGSIYDKAVAESVSREMAEKRAEIIHLMEVGIKAKQTFGWINEQ